MTISTIGLYISNSSNFEINDNNINMGSEYETLYSGSNGDGSKESPYLIFHTKHLEEMAVEINTGSNYEHVSSAYYQVDKSVKYLDTTSVFANVIATNASRPFKGKLDGSFTMLNQDLQLFKYIEDAEIKDFIVSNLHLGKQDKNINRSLIHYSTNSKVSGIIYLNNGQAMITGYLIHSMSSGLVSNILILNSNHVHVNSRTGLIGTMSSGAIVEDVIFKGEIRDSASSNVGAITTTLKGSTIRNVVSYAIHNNFRVTGSMYTSKDIDSVVENTVFAEDFVRSNTVLSDINDPNVIGVNSKDFLGRDLEKYLNNKNNTWFYSEGRVPQLRYFSESDIKLVKMLSNIISEPFEFDESNQLLINVYFLDHNYDLISMDSVKYREMSSIITKPDISDFKEFVDEDGYINTFDRWSDYALNIRREVYTNIIGIPLFKKELFTNFKVSFDTDNKIDLPEMSGNKGESFILPKVDSALLDESYTHTYWVDSQNNDLKYKVGTKYTPYKPNTVLIAIYEVVSYEITYQLNNGKWDLGKDELTGDDIEVIEKYNIETETFDLQIPSRKFYLFTGWYYKDDNNIEYKLEKIIKGTSGDITLYAKWEINTHLESDDSNIGLFIANGIVKNYNFDRTLLNNPKFYLGGDLLGKSFNDLKFLLKNSHYLALTDGTQDVNGNYIELDETTLLYTGSIIIFKDELGNVIDQATIVIEGDLNGDGLINQLDIDLLANHNNKRAVITNNLTLLAANFTNDTKVNILDLISLKKKIK